MRPPRSHTMPIVENTLHVQLTCGHPHEDISCRVRAHAIPKWKSKIALSIVLRPHPAPLRPRPSHIRWNEDLLLMGKLWVNGCRGAGRSTLGIGEGGPVGTPEQGPMGSGAGDPLGLEQVDSVLAYLNEACRTAMERGNVSLTEAN